MGKADSFMFCRMHDLKSTLWPNVDEGFVGIEVRMPPIIESFIEAHSDFPANGVLKAMCAWLSYGEEKRIKYRQQIEMYGDDINVLADKMMEYLDDFRPLTESAADAITNDRSPLYISCLCYTLAWMPRKDPNLHDAACELLDSVLALEASDNALDGEAYKDEQLIWAFLAYLAYFEEWHDAKYGMPIIGKSPWLHGKAPGSGNEAPVSNQNTAPSYKSTDYGSSGSYRSGGCYVATAVYGSYDCPEVWTLRRFRDFFLAKSWYGRIFVRTYYAVSPALVKWFGGTRWFNRLWKGPLDRLVVRLKAEGYEDSPYYDR